MLVRGCQVKSLTFLSLRDSHVIPILNKSKWPKQFRLLATNPDNFMFLPSACGTVMPESTQSVTVRLKFYDKVSEFNFLDNKIFLLISQEAVMPQLHSELKLEFSSSNETSTLSRQSQISKYQIIQYLIFVDCSPVQDLSTHCLNTLTSYVKVYRHSCKALSPEEYSLILKKFKSFGKPKQVWEFNTFMIARYDSPVKLSPALYLKGQYLFSISYMSTQTGKFARALKWKVSKIQAMHSVDNYIVYKEARIHEKEEFHLSIHNLQQPQKQKRRYSFDQDFRLLNVDGTLGVCLTQQYATFIPDLKSQPVRIKFHMVDLGLLCRSELDMFYVKKRKNVTGPGKGTTSSIIKPKSIYVARNFNLKKQLVQADHKYSVCIDQQIQKMIVMQDQGDPDLLFMVIGTSQNISLCSAKTHQTFISILVSINLKVVQLSQLTGIYAHNPLNLVCISSENKALLKLNLDNFGGTQFGSQVVQFKQQASSYVVNSKGRVYLLDADNNLIEYNLDTHNIVRVVRCGRTAVEQVKSVSYSDLDQLVLYVKSEQGYRLETISIS